MSEEAASTEQQPRTPAPHVVSSLIEMGFLQSHVNIAVERFVVCLYTIILSFHTYAEGERWGGVGPCSGWSAGVKGFELWWGWCM